jgi:hypothetical protein
MKQVLTFLVVLLSLSPSPASGQNLDRLYERASQLWALRVSGSKAEQIKFIEPDGRDTFAKYTEPQILKADVLSIEFGNTRRNANVVVRAQMFWPDIGRVEKELHEPWAWNGKEWFLHVADSGNPFAAKSEAPTVNKPVELSFEFVTPKVHLGKHTQGDVVSGQLQFRGSQEQIALILPDDTPGLYFEPVRWENSDSGSFRFSLDTTLLSEDFHKSLKFDAVDLGGKRKSAFLEMTAEIEGRIRFTQVPSFIDTHADGLAVLEIHNMADKPFRLRNVTVTNSSFTLDSDAPDVIRPGETGILKVSYKEQKDESGASLNLVLSEPILGKTTVLFPLQLKAPRQVAPGAYTREQLDQAARKLKP